MEFSSTNIDKQFISTLLKPRDPASHKRTHGHALLVAGNKGRMGAAVIAAKACLRSGVGLLTVNIPEQERIILQVAIPEAMLIMREEDNMPAQISAVAIGPGIGINKTSKQLLKKLLSNQTQPLVLDADALTICAMHKKLLNNIPPGSILTPHPGEFDRLFGKHASMEERQKKALQLSIQHSWVIVLKGQHTQITYEGKVYINSTGNAGLAKGGSGDALTGMCLSFLAQGYMPLHAGILAVYLHGLAADIAVKEQSEESVLITDIIENIGSAFKIIQH